MLGQQRNVGLSLSDGSKVPKFQAILKLSPRRVVSCCHYSSILFQYSKNNEYKELIEGKNSTSSGNNSSSY